MSRAAAADPPRGATAIANAVARGEKVSIERMPSPQLRLMLPMRDGVRLDTQVWLPAEEHRPTPTILCRTPYREEVLGWKRLGVYRYVEDGYALVFQLVRGTGASEGTFGFNAPHDRTDGYDTVEWIAEQSWCDGNVGMDGASYLAMTQLTAAAARPPHLRCIAPHVVTVDPFREPPYFGGGFARHHTLTWTHLIQIESLEELSGGFGDVLPLLSHPDWLRRLFTRPARDAANDLLHGDKLAHYRDVLDHPTYDHWWHERTLQPSDYAAMDLPALVVTGNFDLSIGTLALWRQLEAHAPHPQRRHLLIGPWDHSGSYIGARDTHGPYRLGEHGTVDPYLWRKAFFDAHLRGLGDGPDFGARVHLFLTGRNEWRSFDDFPPREVITQQWALSSGGKANTAGGDGLLRATEPCAGPPDEIRADPDMPVIPVMAHAFGNTLDIREIAAHAEVLVYTSDPLDEPVVIVGEPAVSVTVSYDSVDGDVAVWLAEQTSDGALTQLALGFLRLRYRGGPDREIPLEPGVPVRAEIPLTYVGHQVPAGSRLALLVGASMFPLVDPNPHTGEPVRTADTSHRVRMTVFHDTARVSTLRLPTLPMVSA